MLVLHCVSFGVLPKPLSTVDLGSAHTISRQFDFASIGKAPASQLLLGAFTRYEAVIFGGRKANPDEAAGDIVGCDVNVSSSTEIKDALTDESYTLHVSAPRITISAPTVFGAMYALETLSQLVKAPRSIVGTHIQDRPRFAYRGTMLDTARHFYPLTALKMHIDAMAYAKMNVLHWHIVDGIAFPYQSAVFPQMSKDGAYSSRHVYSIADIHELVAYAMSRGVRVIPEFDMPGHVSRGWQSLGVLTQCYDTTTGAKTNLGALNPTINATYDVLERLMAEVRGSFAPEQYVHVGGDEVPKECWQSNPEITAWLKAHPDVAGFAGLETYFEQRLLSILQAQNSSYMAWQELFDNGAKLHPDTVIEVWKGNGPAALWRFELERVIKAGFRSVLSAPFYLNYISYGADWPKYYSVDPANFTGGSEAESKGLVHGIEACFWSGKTSTPCPLPRPLGSHALTTLEPLPLHPPSRAEFIDATNLASRAWPRAAAVAERAWSDKGVTNLTDAEMRLHEWRCMLLGRGINAEPIGTCSVNAQRIGGPSLQQWCSYQVPGFSGYCPNEWEPVYKAPWNEY